jgi:hypothetical protein
MRFLSQLTPRRFRSANKCWELAGGNEDNYLWALTEMSVDDPSLTEYADLYGRVVQVTSVFVPTDQQRREIAQGQNIALTVIGGQPPVMLRLTDEPLGKGE